MSENLKQHLRTYGTEFKVEIEQTIRQDFNNTKEVTDEIKKQIDNKQADDENTLFIFTDRKLEDRDGYPDALNTVEQSEWYKKAFTAYMNNKIHPLLINSANVIKDAYKKSIQNEIDFAKKEAEKEAKSKADSLLIDQSPFIDKEVRTLKTALNKDIRNVVNDSKQEAKADLIEVEESGSDVR